MSILIPLLIPHNDDAMPFRLVVAFFVDTLPGPPSRKRKNRVFAL
jgi:hypothetical protein